MVIEGAEARVVAARADSVVEESSLMLAIVSRVKIGINEDEGGFLRCPPVPFIERKCSALLSLNAS
jgi:hypothetical protein